MSLVKTFYITEIKQTLTGLLTVLLFGIPTYLVVFTFSIEGYVHFFSGLGFGVIAAALADSYLVWRLLKPLNTGLEETQYLNNNPDERTSVLGFLKNTPLIFFLRILLAHTTLVAIIPGIYMLFRAASIHTFSVGDALIFILINVYLCIGHALVKFFLTESLVQKIFLPFFKDSAYPSLSIYGGKIYRISIRQKIMLTFLLLGMLPLVVITSVSWYKLSAENMNKAGHHLAAETLDLALAGDVFLQQDDYHYLRSLPATMDRHLIFLDKDGNILYSSRQKVIIDQQRLIKEARQKNYDWLFWKDSSVLIGFAWTPSGERLVVQVIHPREAALNMENIQLIIIVLALIGILNALIIGFLASRYLSRSTRLLVEGMHQVNQGDFSTRVLYTTTDEFAFLGSGFNKMVSGLASREAAINELTAGLEEKVQQRTMELESAYNELKLAQQIIADELDLARCVQQSFLPDKTPELPGWKMLAWASPAKEVGGDLYDFIPLGDGRVGIAVGDVAGKSVPAALMMAVSISVLHTAVAGKSSPALVLQHLNQMLTEIMPSRMFLTMTYAILDPNEKSCRIANAGGPAPLFFNPLTGEAKYVDTTGFPLGVFPDSDYEDTVIQLETSEILLFYSDGLVESVDEKGEFFGFPRLEQFGRTSPPYLDLMLERLFEKLKAFTGGAEQYDDITLVALQRNSVDSEEEKA